MLAFAILILAALSRFIPHTMFHAAGVNFTAVGAGLLFFGSRSPRWQAMVAAAVMALTDVILTTQVYGYPFHINGYLVTWAWYAAVALIGSGLLRKVTTLRVVAGVVASATSFFLISNFMVWAGGGIYGRSLYDLVMCYVAGLPFYRNDLISTGLFSAAFFGLPVFAERMVEAMRPSQTTLGA